MILADRNEELEASTNASTFLGSCLALMETSIFIVGGHVWAFR